MRFKKAWATSCSLLLGLQTLGCGSRSALPRARAPSPADDEARCREAALRESPLITEWSAAEKASLQARLREGAVAVEYTGCNMRPILGCRPRGSYVWQQTTLSTDTIDIRNEDELFTKLPLGAAALEGELARSGRLQVRTAVSGQYTLAGSEAGDVPDYGDCAQATHLLTGLSIGSFKLQSGDQIDASASVEILERGGGARTSSSESVLREAGDFESCQLSTVDEPHLGCSSPIQAFLQPLPRFTESRGDGTVQVTFLSGDADVAWELRAEQKFVCRTPCTRWMNPGQAYHLRTETGSAFQALDVPDMRPYVGQGSVEVVAYDTQVGKMTTGIALAASGGGLMFIGGFLALFGGLAASDRGPGLAIAGGATAGVGLLMLGPGIYLAAGSGSKTEVYANDVRVAGAQRREWIASVPNEIGVQVEF